MIWGSSAYEKRHAARRAMEPRRFLRAALFAGVGLTISAGAGRAETIGGALIKAYLTSPDINAQRAAVRVADEGVPKANAGYLPTVDATANIGIQRGQANIITGSGGQSPTANFLAKPRGVGIQANETVFNGNRTLNSIRQAESQVFGAREQLRNTEQNTLLSALTAYMDVLEDTAILGLDRNNVDVLKEQLRETRDRFTVGEVTRTDVAQAEASLAGRTGDRAQRRSDPASRSRALPSIYRRPAEQPCAGEAGREADAENPARGGIDLTDRASGDQRLPARRRRCAIAGEDRRGRALPDYRALRLGHPSNTTQAGCPAIHVLSGQIMGQITIPIYQGGAEYAATRQAKESLSQQEIQTDSLRNQVRQAVVASWGLNEAAVGVVRAARAAVSANEVALTGVREEAKVGQRTTLDVLNAQQALL